MVAMASTQNQSAHVDLFDAYFRPADLDRDGRISGNEAVDFFQGSGLPKQVLAQWLIRGEASRHSPLPDPAINAELILQLVRLRELCYEVINIPSGVSVRPEVQLMPGPGARHMAPPAGGRPPKTVAPSHAEEKQQAN
ncbi:unnamed protein product [Malus baccata var. baccata]